MKNLFPIVILAIILLTGSITQTYYQKDNMITQTTDMMKYISDFAKKTNDKTLAPRMEELFRQACTGMDPSFKCTADGLVLSITKEFGEGQYYTIEKDSNVFVTSYRITVNKIPINVFSEALPRDKFSNQVHLPIDLSDKETNKKNYELQKGAGVKITYTLDAPGSISNAYSGEYRAIINGSKATFDIMEVSKDSAPLVVETTQVNFALIIILICIVFIIVSTLHYNRTRGQNKDYDKKRTNKKKI
ncbi:MAG: hypothetical protein ABII22_03765 [Candidatus Micrarchaeota archaeon]